MYILTLLQTSRRGVKETDGSLVTHVITVYGILSYTLSPKYGSIIGELKTT